MAKLTVIGWDGTKLTDYQQHISVRYPVKNSNDLSNHEFYQQFYVRGKYGVIINEATNKVVAEWYKGKYGVALRF